VLLEACAPDLLACTEVLLLADVLAWAPLCACVAAAAARNALLRIITLATFIMDCSSNEQNPK